MDYFLTPEHKMIKDLARKVAEEKMRPVRAELDEREEFPWEIVKVSAEAGLMGVSIPEEYEGFGGGILGDFAAYDNLGWDGAIHENTYTSLGTKELLLVRHIDAAKLVHTPGDCLYDGTQRERIKARLIEAVSKDPNFFYTKCIWYLDPESWQILYSDRYDRLGRLWKVLDQLGFVGKGYNGLEVAHFNANQMIDVQRVHSTMAIAEFTFRLDFDRSTFTLNNLQKRGY